MTNEQIGEWQREVMQRLEAWMARTAEEIRSSEERAQQRHEQSEAAYEARVRDAIGREEKRLRDWFAGLAMQGLVGNADYIPDSSADVVANDAYKIADHMLAAPTKRGEGEGR